MTNLLFLAVCTVAAGHKMFAEGWAMFEQAAEAVGPGQLLALLRQLVSNVTLTPSMPTPVPTPTTSSEEPKPMTSSVTQVKQEFVEELVMIKLGTNNYKYGCTNCDVIPKVSKCAMDAHICSAHT